MAAPYKYNHLRQGRAMTTPLSFIELTRHLSPRRGYAPAPRFHAHVWPLILRHADSIKETFLFFNSRWCGNKNAFYAGKEVSPNIVSINSLEWLSPNQFKEIDRRIHAEGHLNVLFTIELTSSLLGQLLDLWNTHGKIVWGTADDLGLKSEELEELAKLISNSKESGIVAGFGHEAEPLYLFASQEMLKLLLHEASI